MSSEQPRRKSYVEAVIEYDGSDEGRVCVDFLDADQSLRDIVNAAAIVAAFHEVPVEHVNIRFAGVDRWHALILSMPPEDAAVVLERDQETGDEV